MKWNKEKVDFLKNNWMNFTDSELVSQLGTTQGAIVSKRRRLNLMRKKVGAKSKSSDYTYEQINTMFTDRGYKLLSNSFNKMSEKLEYICNKHKDYGSQFITFSDFKRGKGCMCCGRERTNEAIKKRSKTDEEFKQICIERDFTYVGKKVINNVTNMLFYCNKHKDRGIQNKSISNLDTGCKYCSNTYNYTRYDFIKLLHDKRDDIELIGDYINLITKTEFYCKIHHEKFLSTPSNVLHNNVGCKICSAENRSNASTLTLENAQKEVNKVNPHIEILSYEGSCSITKCYCKKHNKYFDKYYGTLKYSKSGCDDCYKENIRKYCGKTDDEFKNELNLIHPEIIVLDNYITQNMEMNFYCKKHKHYFKSTPYSVLNNASCCSKGFKTVKENEIGDLLENWGYVVERQKRFFDCKDKKTLPFDFYLTDFNIAIEFQGEQHYYPVSFRNESYKESEDKFKITQLHDKIKKDYCENNNINLICIPYWEYEGKEHFLWNELYKYNAIKELTNN